MAKKLLALLVAAMMVLALVPAAAFAKTNPKTDTVENADLAPKPAPVRTVIDSWDFEEDPLENGWQFLDNDEDGNNWSWQSSSYVHSGSYSIMSASYSGTALTPDNWAMSPWFSVPEGGANLTFWVQNYSSSYPETYSVYFIVYGDEEWNEIALDESVSGSAMVEMSYFIPDTAGLQARIAIRHHDCTDQWRFYIDDVEISTLTFPESLTVNDVTVPVGRHTNVVYEILPEDTTATDVTFEIDDTSIATVDANGVVTGVAEGTATITVTSVAVPTVSGTATVTVTEAPPTAHLEGFATYDLGSTYTKHFVAFTDADPGTVTDLVNFNTTTYAAAYYDGTVYGYNYNSSSNPAETNYYTMNAETYEVVYPGGDASAVGGVFGMAYNYANDTMYALTGADTRSIGTVDLETGVVTNIAAITGMADAPMTLAIDGEGNAYVLELTSGDLYSLDLETGAATLIGATGVSLSYVQSMTWDHETNQLFWAQLSSATDHGLYVIDPETGAASALGTIGASGMEITCLYSKSAPGEEPPTELLPITEVYVNGYESPVAGEDSQNHLNFTVPADAHYTIENESYSAPGWWDNDADLPFSDIFVEGTNYSAGMTLIAEEGYYFADEIVIYVNNDENLVDWTYSGLDLDTGDNTLCYVWTVPEPATAPVELNDLDAALNAPGGTLHFETSETYPWIVVEDGDRVFAQSGNAGVASTTSTLTLNVDLEEAQTIYFEFKAWGEGSYTFWDHCDFAIDGEVQFTYGAYDNDWELYSCLVPAGAHTLTWTYTKDSSVNPTGDYFAVDNVSLGAAPEYTVTFVDGLDNTVLGEITVEAGTVLTDDDFPTPPEHDGYEFVGWNYNGDAIMQDTTITARYRDPNAPNATIILNVPVDVWSDGSGYQMLLDADATAYGTIIPETGGLTSSGDAPAGVYDEFEYKIPENADGSMTTSNVVVTGQIAIEIPAGIYDWCITNPTPGDRIWIASSNGNIPGRYDDYEFEAGLTYTFTVTLGGQNDRVDLEISGDTPPTEPPTTEPPTTEPPTNPPTDEPVEGLIVGYYFETQEEVDEWTFVGGDTNWVWSFDNPGGYDYTELAHEGEGFIMSYSFVDYVGSYQANNWAISPAVTLPSGTASVSFYASNANSDYPETFSVYVGTTPNTADMTLLQTITPTTGYDDEWSFYEIDLSDYAGQTIYLAFYDGCYDMYEIWIDQVEFWGESGETPPPVGNVIEQVEILDFVEPAWGEAPFYGVTVPDGAHYSISEAYWFWYNEEDGDEMYDGDLFDDPNKLYYMGITLVPEEGYEFLANEEGDIVALINGSEALVDYAWTEDGEAYVMTIDFTVEDPGAPELIPIHEVWVDGWGTPVEDVVGVDHVFLTTPDDAPYYIIYGGWLDETDGQQMWNEDYVFIAGHLYSEGCQIWAEEGYYFADDCVFLTHDDAELDPEYCYVDPDEDYICYMNIVPVVCEGEVGRTYGDVDLNGTVEVADAILALRYQMGLIELTDEQLDQAEVTGNGVVSIADSILILRYAMGLIDHFPIEG